MKPPLPLSSWPSVPASVFGMIGMSLVSKGIGRAQMAAGRCPPAMLAPLSPLAGLCFRFGEAAAGWPEGLSHWLMNPKPLLLVLGARMMGKDEERAQRLLRFLCRSLQTAIISFPQTINLLGAIFNCDRLVGHPKPSISGATLISNRLSGPVTVPVAWAHVAERGDGAW